MYMRDFGASLARRWILVVLLLATTAGLTYAVSQQVRPTYEARADVVLVPPKSVEDPTLNRYLALGGLRQAVDVLTRSLTAEQTRDEVKAAAPAGTFDAVADPTTSAPILVVTAKAATADEARSLLEAVLGQVPSTLRELQETVDIAEASQIMPQVVASDKDPQAVNKKQVRAIGAAAALLLFLSAMLVAFVDNRLLVRAYARKIAEERARFHASEPLVAPDTAPLVAPDTAPRRPIIGVRVETRARDVVSAKVRS